MSETDNATDAAPVEAPAPVDEVTIPPAPVPAPTLAHEDLTTREASLVAHIKAWASETFGSKA